MLWAVTRRVAVDDFEAKREEGLQDHVDYLRSRKDVVVVSGGTTTDDGTRTTGSVLVISVASREEAEAFVEGDPFQQAGCFTDVRITRMRKGQWNPETGDRA